MKHFFQAKLFHFLVGVFSLSHLSSISQRGLFVNQDEFYSLTVCYLQGYLQFQKEIVKQISNVWLYFYHLIDMMHQIPVFYPLSFPSIEVILTYTIIWLQSLCLFMNRVHCLLTCFSVDIYGDRLYMRKWGKTIAGDSYTMQTMLDKFTPKFLYNFLSVCHLNSVIYLYFNL